MRLRRPQPAPPAPTWAQRAAARLWRLGALFVAVVALLEVGAHEPAVAWLVLAVAAGVAVARRRARSRRES